MRWLPILGVLAACGGGGGGPEEDAAPDGVTRVDQAGGSQWRSAPPVAGGPIQETGVVAVDGKIYVLGGFTGTGEIVDAVRVFDTATQAWSDGPTLPAPVHHTSATVHDGTIYVLGMLSGVGFSASGATWAFTPGTDTGWRVRASMPAGSERGAAVSGSIGDRILVAGGFAGGAVATALAYDPLADTWDELPSLPAPRDHACGAAYDGALYVAGGREAGTADVRSTMYAFVDGAWVERAPMPTGRGGTACGLFGSQIFVVGGEGNPDVASGVFPQVEWYDTANDRWSTSQPMITPRHGMGAAVWDDLLYVPGGADVEGFGAVDTFEVFTP